MGLWGEGIIHNLINRNRLTLPLELNHPQHLHPKLILHLLVNALRHQNLIRFRNAENTTPTTVEQFAKEVFAPAYNAAG